MTSRIAALALDTIRPETVARFWCDVLGWEVLGTDDGVVSIGAADGSWPTIDVVPVPEVKTVKNRIHLDLRADGTTWDAELTRLRGLGARDVDVGQGDDVTWVVLADPEGNEFCLLLRTVEQAR